MRTILLSSLIGLLLPVAAIMGFNFSVDRYQYYRPWTGAQPIFSANARWQNAGLIRQYDYDTVLIGTSRSENFASPMFDPAGWRLLKVTAAGSHADEQLAILDLALNTGKARRVLYELSEFSFIRSGTNNQATFPEFLYRPRLETPFLYLLSYDLLRESIAVRRGAVQSTELDDLNVWWPSYRKQFGKAQVMAKLQRGCDAGGDLLGNDQVDTRVQQLGQRIGAYPGVDFVAFFPPTAAISLHLVGEVALARWLHFREAIASLARRLPNLTVYDYTAYAPIVLDLDRYKDPGHFDINATRQMAIELSHGTAPVAESAAINVPLRRVMAAIDPSQLPCRRQR